MQNVTFFPENISKNSLAIINYFGNLNSTSEKIYIEYSYDQTPENYNSIRKAEMSKINSYSFAIISVENADKLYFRFTNEIGTIDDNNKTFYQKDIESQSNEAYFEASSLLNGYKNSNNNSNVVLEICDLQDLNSTQNNKLNQKNDDKEINNQNTSMALVPLKDMDLIHARKGLRFSYKLNKRIKLLLIKLFRKLPSFITGNYRRRINL